MHSMTGYAAKSAEFDDYTLFVKIKSLNNKFLETKFRLPSYFEHLEEKLKQVLKRFVKRGMIESVIKVTAKEHVGLSCITSMLSTYYNTIKELEARLSLCFDVSLSELLALHNLFHPNDEPDYIHIPDETVIGVYSDTLETLQKFRSVEGENTKRELSDHIEKMKASIQRIATRCPSIIEKYKEQLKEKIGELMEDKVDDARLMMEIGIYASKLDISEEVSRINGHLGRMKKTLGSDGVCGRELDFIAQEINREINTIGSKVPDYPVSEEVIRVKLCLEKIKEQVRNIE